MDILQKLVDLTGDESWKTIEGPESGNGLDYWFANDKNDEAYANDDQGYVAIAINGQPSWNNEWDFIHSPS